MSDEEKTPEGQEKKKNVREAETIIWSDGHASALKASLAKLMQEKAEKDAKKED